MDTLKAEGALKFDFGGEEVVLTEDDLLIDMAPVSYTHLDVYKRQA